MRHASSVNTVTGGGSKRISPGSIEAYHAEDLWEIEELDSIAVRESASAVVRDPFNMQIDGDTRHQRRIKRELVAKFIPPEQEL